MTDPDLLDTVLLLALPASGKSEVRKYLAAQPADALRREFHLGPMAELDDFPYVHLMRRVDAELSRVGRPVVFYDGPDAPFLERRDWGSLIALLNDDHADRLAGRAPRPTSAGAWLLDRLDAARLRVGARPALADLPRDARARLADALEPDARAQLDAIAAACATPLAGSTLVVEFARGGPEGHAMPLVAPYGYGYALSVLSPALLERASILYIWVTPEESRRKNRARANPDDPGSILHHGVPEVVMRADYGCDDIEWLLSQSDRRGTIRVESHGRVFHVPAARLDNRIDKTSFVREDRVRWRDADVAALHGALRDALEELHERRRG